MRLWSKPEQLIGWTLFVGAGFSPLVASLAGAPLEEGTQMLSAMVLIIGALVLYAGDGLVFARRDPLGFGSIALPALALPAIGLATGFLLMGSALGIGLVMAFAVAGNRVWPIWTRSVLRRRVVSSEREFERAALSRIRGIVHRLVGAVDDPEGCVAHLQIARQDLLDLAVLRAPSADWAAVRDGYVRRLSLLLDHSRDPASLKRGLQAWAADDEVKVLRDRLDDLAGAPRRIAERAAASDIRHAD